MNRVYTSGCCLTSFQQFFSYIMTRTSLYSKRKVENPSQNFLILTMLLSGDIHYNPGPVKHPCTDCNKPVKSNQKAIQCNFCDLWTHLKCTKLTVSEYNLMSKSNDFFIVIAVKIDFQISQIRFLIFHVIPNLARP
jgi:hypothetical protein